MWKGTTDKTVLKALQFGSAELAAQKCHLLGVVLVMGFLPSFPLALVSLDLPLELLGVSLISHLAVISMCLVFFCTGDCLNTPMKHCMLWNRNNQLLKALDWCQENECLRLLPANPSSNKAPEFGPVGLCICM